MLSVAMAPSRKRLRKSTAAALLLKIDAWVQATFAIACIADTTLPMVATDLGSRVRVFALILDVPSRLLFWQHGIV